MDSVTKWEYLTAWRYTAQLLIPKKGMFGGNKKVTREALAVKGDGREVQYLEERLNQLGAEGWELVTETSLVSEVDPPMIVRLASLATVDPGRVRTHGYKLVFKRPIDEAKAKKRLTQIEADDD